MTSGAFHEHMGAFCSQKQTGSLCCFTGAHILLVQAVARKANTARLQGSLTCSWSRPQAGLRTTLVSTARVAVGSCGPHSLDAPASST